MDLLQRRNSPYLKVNWSHAVPEQFKQDPKGEVVSFGLESFLNADDYKDRREDIIGVVAIHTEDVIEWYETLSSKRDVIVPAIGYFEWDNSYIGTFPPEFKFGKNSEWANEYLIGCKLKPDIRFTPGFYVPGELFYQPENTQPIGIFTLEEIAASLPGIPIIRK